MGRALIPLACDNCIPGDASPYYLPLAAVAIGAGALALVAQRRARRLAGRRKALLRAGAVVLLAGPLAAIFVASTDVTYDRAACGSALAASLLEPRPGFALDPVQSGCRDKGERVVRGATAYGAATTGAALLLLAGGAVPGRRPARIG